MKDWNAAPILSARNLTRRYGEHIGCRDVSFDLWPGEVLGIVGESGSGKSTLLNMLSGRMEPTSGTIAYRDAAGRERNIHALPSTTAGSPTSPTGVHGDFCFAMPAACRRRSCSIRSASSSE